MRFSEIREDGRIVKGVNTTVDVGVNQLSIEAAKLGYDVDKDGRPPTLSKKVKRKSTNVLFNLGLAEATKLELPDINVGDEVLVGKFKNRKAEVKGFSKDDKNQPVLKTTKGDQKLFKPRISKLMVDNTNKHVLYYKHMYEAINKLNKTTEIYVDMDGVLADFFGEWAKLMNVDHFSDIHKQHDIDDALQKIRDTDDFWLQLPLLPEAKKLLSLIKKVKGEYNICTSPLADDPNSEPHKREWIKKNLAFFPPKNIYITHNKPQYATAQNGSANILIDDYGVNINAWEAAGGIGFKHKDHKFERTAKDIKQHMADTNPVS